MKMYSNSMPPIKNFFANKSVLLTGGFGFLGKLVAEKLLYSCPNISKIYLVARSKNSQSPEERLQSMLQGPVFGRIKKLDEARLKKIVVLNGDMTQPNIGLEHEFVEKLVKDVNVILHCAASVRFDEPLSVALRSNSLATKNALELATSIKELQAFVYVSTAYSQCHRKNVEEILYPQEEELNSVIALSKSMDLKQSLQFVRQRGMPNTYTFTKRLAETIVHEFSDRVPVSIVRPSIIGATLEEPVPGFVQSFSALTGHLYIFAKRLLPLIVADKGTLFDVVPADICANTVIAASVMRAVLLQEDLSSSCPIYNATAETAIRVEDVRDKASKYSALLERKPSRTENWFKTGLTKYVPLYEAVFWSAVMGSACLTDMMAVIKGHPARARRSALQLKTTTDSLQFFRQNSWNFNKCNVRALENALHFEDRKNFRLRTDSSMDVDQYYKDYIQGIRDFILAKNI